MTTSTGHENPPATIPAVHPLAVDAKKLGAMLGLSERTIRTMDSAGKLPRPLKLNGHSVRWQVSEIETWLAAGGPDRPTWESIKKTA